MLTAFAKMTSLIEVSKSTPNKSAAKKLVVTAIIRHVIVLIKDRYRFSRIDHYTVYTLIKFQLNYVLFHNMYKTFCFCAG